MREGEGEREREGETDREIDPLDATEREGRLAYELHDQERVAYTKFHNQERVLR